VFFAGLIPVETLPYNLGNLSGLVPLFYGAMGIKEVAIFGGGLAEAAPYLGALCIFIAIFFVLNVLVIRRYRSR
jgi:ABC-2 type transport system permease protein